ncbi:MAG: hypothetical protein KAT66_10010 [Candidatus Lokiarchaeota archaeon]|nr:hypothetical protein [Candidatus Lokiarchaeota archaeon]
MLRHTFPKDTVANSVVGIIDSLYSGIFLFYIFGGFSVGQTFGDYRIELENLQVLLGLQLIAWLLLSAAGIKALQHIVRTIELSRKKEYHVTIKRQFKASTFFRAIGTLANISLALYFLSIIISGANISFNLHDTFAIGHDDGGSPLNPADDTINITITFDVRNRGVYAVHDVNLNVEIYNVSTSPSEKIGELAGVHYFEFSSFSTTKDKNLTVLIDPTYAPALAAYGATLSFRISFLALYAGIFIDLNFSIEVPWAPLIP